MDKQIEDRMAGMFFAMLQGELPEGDDMAFFTNHLSSFTTLMNRQAIEALEEMGIEPQVAELIIHGTVILNKMNGAHSFNDFCITQELAESLGEV